MNVNQPTNAQPTQAHVNQRSYIGTKCTVVGVAIGSFAVLAGLFSILASKGMPLGAFNALGNLNQIYAIGLISFGGLTLGSVAISKLCKSNHPVPSSSDKTKHVESVPLPTKEVDSKKEKNETDKSKELTAPHSTQMQSQLPNKDHITLSPRFFSHSMKEREIVKSEVALLRTLLAPFDQKEIVCYSGEHHPTRPYYAVFFKETDDKICVRIFDNATDASTFLGGKTTLSFKVKSIINKDQIIQKQINSQGTCCKVDECSSRQFTYLCTSRKDPSSGRMNITFEIFSNQDPMLTSRIEQIEKEGISIERDEFLED